MFLSFLASIGACDRRVGDLCRQIWKSLCTGIASIEAIRLIGAVPIRQGDCGQI